MSHFRRALCVARSLAWIIAFSSPAIAQPLDRLFVPIPKGPDVRVLATDLNRDGRSDLLALEPGAGTLQVLVNRDGSFFPTMLWETIRSPSGIFAGTIDGKDELVDVLVYNPQDAFVSLGFGDGTGRFPFRTQLFHLVDADPDGRFFFGDVDEDGLVDMVTSGEDGGVLVAAPVFTSRLPRVFETSVSQQDVFASGDFNRDGRSDLLIWGKGLVSQLEILEGSDREGFRHAYSLPVLPPPGGDPRSVAVFDLDGTRGSEAILLAVDEASSTGFLYLLGWKEGYTVRRLGPPIPIIDETELLAADMDGDGRNEIVFIGRDFEPTEAVWMLSFDETTGGLGAPCFLYPSGTPGNMTFGEFDLLADLDVAVTLTDRADAEIIFSATRVCDLVESCYRHGQRLERKAFDYVDAGRFDGPDGHDLLVVDSTSLSILSFGRAGFRETLKVALARSPDGVAVGDLDSDGRDDVVLLDRTARHVRLLTLGQGPSVDGELTIPIDGVPSSGVVVDLDGDRREDLAVAVAVGEVQVFHQLGSGEIAEAGRFSVGAEVWQIAAGDVDGDGTVDLVVLEPTGRRVRLLAGGGGGFTEVASGPVGGAGVNLELADLDRDGDAEILVVSPQSDLLTVLSFDEGGRLLRPFFRELPPGSLPSGVTAETESEVIVANAGSRSLSLFEVEDGTVASFARPVVPGFPPVVPVMQGEDMIFAVGDFDRDGRNDFVLAERLTGSVDIVLSGNCGGESNFRRGDVDRNGQINLSDAVAVLSYLFRGSGALSCADAADADDDGALLLTDAVALLGYLFRSEGELVPPGPDLCGADPTVDDLPDCTGSCFR